MIKEGTGNVDYSSYRGEYRSFIFYTTQECNLDPLGKWVPDCMCSGSDR